MSVTPTLTDVFPGRPRVLALVGMPGSGKTLCAKHLENQGYFQFRFGQIVVDEVKRRGWEGTQDHERQVREELRRDGGMDAIARRAMPLLKDALNAHECVVIDGLYSFSEYKLLRQELAVDIVVIAITAPRWLRYSRLAARPERGLTAQEAEERDWREIETLEKGGPIAIADFTLVNDSDSDILLTKLDDIMAQLALQP